MSTSTKNAPKNAPKNTVTTNRQKKLSSTPRSPLKLKNLNVSCSSSFSSTEGPKGCLRFFLSHHSCNAANNRNVGINGKNKCGSMVSKTPKSAPNVRSVVRKSSTLRNPEKVPSRRVKKNHPPAWKFGGKCSSRYDLSDGVNKFSSGFRLKLSDDGDFGSMRERGSGNEVGLSDCDGVVDVRKLSSRYGICGELRKGSSGVELDSGDDGEKVSAGENLGSGCGLGGFSRGGGVVELVEKVVDCHDVSRSPTPPPAVQSSVSPEIQGGSMMSVMGATPSTCYAAGHVMSGVTDKRKCRPRGILTIGDNDLFGSSKAKMFDSESEGVIRVSNSRRDSVVPSPTGASVRWLLSPCDEKRSEDRYDDDDDDDDDDTDGMSINKCKKVMPLKSIGCSSSPSSSLGFSSEMFNKSNSTITTSDATTATTHSSSRRRRRSSCLNSDLSSEFRGLLGPSFDHLVCSPSPSSPVSTPNCNVEVSAKEGKNRYDHEREATPHLEDSIGSGNLIQTPHSNSSSSDFELSYMSPQPNSRSPDFGLSHLSKDEKSKLWFECELDSVAEVLRRVSLSPDCQPIMDSPRMSFEFNPLIKPNSSIDLTLFRKAMDSQTPPAEISELRCSPEVRISWREGLTSRIFEMDELDCCRCLSDEEDDAKGCSDTFESCSCPEITAVCLNKNATGTCSPSTSVQYEDFESCSCAETTAICLNKNAADTCSPSASVQHEDSTNATHEDCNPPDGPNPYAESISNGEPYEPDNSSWTICYRNNLFQV